MCTSTCKSFYSSYIDFFIQRPHRFLEVEMCYSVVLRHVFCFQFVFVCFLCAVWFPVSCFILLSFDSVRVWPCFFNFMYGACFLGQLPWSFFTYHSFILHFVLRLLSHVCFALVSSSIFCCSSSAREFSHAYYTDLFLLFIYSHYHFTLQFLVGGLERVWQNSQKPVKIMSPSSLWVFACTHCQAYRNNYWKHFRHLKLQCSKMSD